MMAAQGVRVPLVLFGHMHSQLKGVWGLPGRGDGGALQGVQKEHATPWLAASRRPREPPNRRRATTLRTHTPLPPAALQAAAFATWRRWTQTAASYT